MPKKILICPDSFKGSLSAMQVCDTIERSVKEEYPDIEIVKQPLADGGEGSADIICRYFPVKQSVKCFDAILEPVEANYYINERGKKAFIESASAIGLPLISPQKRNPMEASSYGLGQMINYAISLGINDITVSLGGSACCDGGMGMLKALGVKFFDSKNKELRGVGKDMENLTIIDTTGVSEYLRNVKFTVVNDVENPLYGPQGAAKIYAPQKGASPQDIEKLDKGLKNLSKVYIESGISSSGDENLQGSGAAGGLGYSFMTFLKATAVKGIDYFMNLVDFNKKLEGCGLVISGEGKLDGQSLMGKVVSGVIERTINKNVSLILVAGSCENPDIFKNTNVNLIFKTSANNLSLEENMKPQIANENLYIATKIMLKSNIFRHFLS